MKLGLFPVYLATLIIVLRILDWASWRGQPEELMSMPVARFALLEQRGVEYSHLYEKAEFSSKIEATSKCKCA
ncbi:hypothetical protein DPMN_056570 [Dreissena polymorpha]|uniref:Uncharacterized protein n=1 Tax=Dreissena polymorpha TaxID=45954 RepID=A0A9D4HTL8_DREPO|nr:hypothetical protein DPMN_056561 [Dreissena polymorpha]KAH3730580.1 hypothetical protein DPMN_056570 [Dreissena polymorpha]